MSIVLLVLLVAGLAVGLLAGIPVAFVLGGVALWIALLGQLLGVFDTSYLAAYPNRVFGIMGNETLLAVPLFVFMGVMLERSRLAEELLESVAAAFGERRGGLAIAVLLVGALLAASTGIVGATVVTMGLISLPVMLRNGYCPRLASGTLCAAGTLGQIIPPSIVLVLLGDQLGNAYQQAQLKLGNFSPDTVSVGDLFAGAVAPGLLLVSLYLIYVLWVAWRDPQRAPAIEASRRQQRSWRRLLRATVPPLGLIVAVLGSILAGVATPTEAAAVGAVGATVFAAALTAHLDGWYWKPVQAGLDDGSDAFEPRLGKALEWRHWKKGEPREPFSISVGVPMVLPLNVVNWMGGRGGHVGFSPILPPSGELAYEAFLRRKRRFEEAGLDYYSSFTVGHRHIANVNMILYNRDDADMVRRTKTLFSQMIADAREEGYGEYRTHIEYMDAVADTYDYNNHALRRLNETVKDALDPNGVIAPGRNGIWPARLREGRR